MRPSLAFACTCLVALVTFTALAPPALAAWPHQPTVNVPVCTAANTQDNPRIVADGMPPPGGSSGAIIVWVDARGGSNTDIYAQHVLASGVVDPAWPADGRVICSAAQVQRNPQVVEDGSGGAIITWEDYRSVSYADIYAQHVLASGVVDPAWPADGRAVCTAAYHQLEPMIATDGAGGAIITWTDQRPGSYSDIYAQRVLASGAVDPAWPADGRALCTAANVQQYTTIVSDGVGGAIVAWEDYRLGFALDIYAQRVLASGAVDPAWPANGRALCMAAYDQSSPQIISDGMGGGIVAWSDRRSGTNSDIYANHIRATGTVDGGWSSDGRALCTATNDQSIVRLASDGAGGAIATWMDYRSGSRYDIYTQRVLAGGQVDPAWPSDGRALCTASNDKWLPRIVADGTGGAFVAWYDFRSGSSYDIYAQHVLGTGVVASGWAADGQAVGTASADQVGATLVSDGSGGAIVTWNDFRGGSYYDIYTQRIGRHGYLGTPEPAIVGVRDVPGDQGGKVKLSWNASYLDTQSDPNLSNYDIWRSVPPNVAAGRAERGEQLATSYEEALADPGRMLVMRDGATSYAWEYVTTQAAYHYVSAYSVLAPTAQDSTSEGAPETAFMVVARNAGNTMFWPSLPDSGYSVDNLAPVTPAPFTGQYAAGASSLHWNPNLESDLAGYRLYRGPTGDFVPAPSNLVVAQPDTGYVDAAGAPYYYKLTAVDVHGNESTPALLLPSGPLGVEGPPARVLALSRPEPSPARTATRLGFALSREGQARVAVYDAAGRRVRVLVDGMRGAGEQAVEWDLRDDGGRAVGAGLYIVRLEAEGRVLTRRVMALR